MRLLVITLLLVSLGTTVSAQSNYKESTNSFARYTQTGDLKQLESAKKFIDDTYKTRRDSNASKNNILRALIYSSLAYADSTRRIKTDKDPIDIAQNALSRLSSRDRSNYANELNYVNQNLSAAYIGIANKAIQDKDFGKAYASFLKVHDLGLRNHDVLNNLAQLAAKSGNPNDAVRYYNELIKETDASVDKYLALANLYKDNKDSQLYLNTLQDARNKFMDNQTILFLLIQVYSENKSYAAVTTLVDEALKYEPQNTELLYLAGYANENTGHTDIAKKYYLRLNDIDPNNFDSNLALGLIFLNDFLKNEDDLEAQYKAQEYLLMANGIRPYAVNALKGLALFYEKTDDGDQLDRVNTLLNQLSNN